MTLERWIAHFQCKHCKEHFIVYDVFGVVSHAAINHGIAITSDPNLVIVNNFNIIQDWKQI